MSVLVATKTVCGQESALAINVARSGLAFTALAAIVYPGQMSGCHSIAALSGLDECLAVTAFAALFGLDECLAVTAFASRGWPG